MPDDVTAMALEILRVEFAKDHLDLELCESEVPDTISAAIRAIEAAIIAERERCATLAPAAPVEGMVERVARAICASKDINPDCLYQHNFEGDWPEDDRREYRDSFTGEMRTMLFHKSWRHSEKAALAAIAAMLDKPQGVGDK